MRRGFQAGVFLVAVVAAACGQPEAGLRIPIGAAVTIERRDGTTVSGTLKSVDPDSVTVEQPAGPLSVTTADLVAVRAVLAASIPAASSGREKPRKGPVARRADVAVADSAYQDYRVPAGTLLPIELRSTLSSSGSQRNDQVRGRLLEPLEVNGVEVVPAGATLLGTVTDVINATEDKQRSRLALRFQVLEHPDTGSHVTLKTVEASFDSPAAIGHDVTVASPDVKVVLRPGANVSVSLLEPFTVRIPGRG